MKALVQLQEREISIAPLIIQLLGCCVHVTPLGVPFPKKSVTKSDLKGKGKGKGKANEKVKAKGKEEPAKDKITNILHIIELFSSKHKTCQVDLLIKDDSHHVLVLSDSEKARGTKCGPAKWYAFSNEIEMLPKFIHATNMKMISDYSDS